ncbi:MAG: ABC transporter permease [Ilumatobacteraceae bacterium]
MALAALTVTTAPPPATAGAHLRRLAVPGTVLVALAVVGALTGTTVPSWLDAHVVDAVDSVYDWTVRNNSDHWLFTWIFQPISEGVDRATEAVLWVLRQLRWPGVLAVVGVVGWRTGGTRATVTGVLALAGCGVLGFWDDTLVTLALMLVAVAVALVIGVPLGIWAGRNDRAERGLRGVLDTAQVMPAYVYLLPAVVVFGIGTPAAIVATVVFAVAPAVRLTSHGLRSVPVVATEVGTSFGCTSRQLLAKVQLPMARRAMLLGLNQVIMMAFAIVVIAALVGTGGLGQRVVDGLERVDVGLAFAPGLAIVFAAIALDRITTGERVRRPRTAERSRVGPPWAATLGIGAAVVLATVAAGRLFGAADFPDGWRFDVAEPVNDAVGWVNDHLRTGVPVIGGTGSISDFLVINVLNPVRDVLVDSPWWLIVVAVVAIGWASSGWRLGALGGACFVGVAAMRNWELAMDTLSQVLVVVVISVALAVPIGIWAGRSDRVQRVLRPVLDAAQVMPAFVYLVPVIFLFRVGRVPGVVAAVVYALPPCIRIVSLGLRQVPHQPREAAISFGATPGQELRKVQLPMATPAILLGVNQTVLLVLSMVVIAGLTGSGGLGLETVYGLTKGEVGRGVAGGVSIVLLAITLDRITQAWGARSGQHRHQGAR